ncbi:MAG: autotransporter outer membrane beta-barrel domain-containing protein, partial [Deltaproteobacteria bacterium]|nr:autotransporter outer membrane beta-barrel domain-containing protein [Deltaproteobacteria bacterium]
FDEVTVGGVLSVSTGADNDATAGAGSSKFIAYSLSAPEIILNRAGAQNKADLDFYAGTLDVTAQNTLITADNTINGTAPTSLTLPAAIGFGAYFGLVDINNGKEFRVDNADGEVHVGQMDIGSRGGRIQVADSDNLLLDALNARDTTLTLVAPTGYDGQKPLLKATSADLTDSVLLLDGDLDNFGVDTTIIESNSLSEPLDVRVDPYTSGLTLRYDLDWVIVGDDIVGNIYGISAHPVMKALSEGQVASQAFVNRGSDFVAGEGISSAVFAAADAGFSFFSAVSYGHERYETGSHVDVGGVSILLGGAYGTDVSAGRLTVGAFFELGDGTYDSYNDLAGYGTVNGSGDTKYVGGGLLGRLDFAGSSTGHTYLEASGRVGRVSADFESADLPLTHRYDLSSTYYGFHVGVGRVFNISDSTTFDLYGKWLFTHQGGKDLSVAGVPVHFDDISSHRLRAGFRISTEVNEWFKPYFGAAYEHELDGKAEGTVRGFAIDVPELKGGSGIGEIGVSFAAADRLTVDLSVQGYVGQRQGVSGGLRLVYNF